MSRIARSSLLLAATALALPACATKAQTGAAVGAGVGALGGAVIGHNSGKGRHAGKGAAIGAAAGALGGYVIGNEMDKADDRERREQEQYEPKVYESAPRR